jgi:hypothetical protein
MDYVSFMRRVDGKPPKVEPVVITSGFYYTGGMRVKIHCIRSALSGQYEDIHRAFTWVNTPQGYGHWDAINEGNTQLTDADVQYLEWMLEEYS